MGRNAARVARSLYSWPRVFDELFCIYRASFAQNTADLNADR